MKKFIAFCGISLMLFVVAAPTVIDVGSVALSSKVYKPQVVDLVYINDATQPDVLPVYARSLNVYSTSDLLSGVKSKVATNNNSPPTIRYLRC